MISINLFPTLVALFDNPDQLKHKDIFNKKYSNLKYYQVGEQQGQNTLHLDNDLDELYKFIIKSVNEYLKQLNLNTDNFYLVVAKSWMSFVNKNNGVPPHNHSDHQLSFTYYIDAPEDSCDVICFSDNKRNTNEPFYGAFNSNIGNPPNIFGENMYNSLNYTLKIKEGQLCVFPSKLDHSVPKGNFKNDRKCIAGDLLLIYKDLNNNNPWGLYKPENWKYYETKMD
jgi:hypothetical protein